MRLSIIMIIVGLYHGFYAYSSDGNVRIKIAKIGDSIADSGVSKIEFKYTYIDTIARRDKPIDNMLEYMFPSKDVKESPLAEVSPLNVDIFFKHTKRRVIETWDASAADGEKFTFHHVTAYNNEKTDYFYNNKGSNSKELIQQVAISPRYNISDPVTDPRYCGYYILGTPVHKFLTGEFHNADLAYTIELKDKTVNGIHCNVIKGGTANGDSTIIAYLAPEYFYRPVKIELFGKGFILTSKAEYQLCDNNVWFPKMIYYSRDVDGSNDSIASFKAEMKVLNVELCDDIDDDMFEIRFPRGMRVYDARTDEVFVVEYDLDEQ